MFIQIFSRLLTHLRYYSLIIQPLCTQYQYNITWYPHNYCINIMKRSMPAYVCQLPNRESYMSYCQPYCQVMLGKVLNRAYEVFSTFEQYKEQTSRTYKQGFRHQFLLIFSTKCEQKIDGLAVVILSDITTYKIKFLRRVCLSV